MPINKLEKKGAKKANKTAMNKVIILISIHHFGPYISSNLPNKNDPIQAKIFKTIPNINVSVNVKSNVSIAYAPPSANIVIKASL